MAVLLEIKVFPQSGRQGCMLDKAKSLRCYLKSSPENGKANEELIKILAKALSLPQADFKIVRGATARKKVIKIETALDLAAVTQKLTRKG